ncbi:uncharacterized protein CCR75_003376 [Bremia lactucae]|uniref:Lysosomal thioesterase PPT2 n=1 Tax=Bremia lactucae TaxID=4779 RepID=A0A976IHK1_BRELC|nr:hypothetical protein CCR75_003376 [Bremia lactucae]
MFPSHVFFALLSSALIVTTGATEFGKLPVFFFHGVNGNRSSADNYVEKLSAEGRTVVPLSFCEQSCSLTAIPLQVPMAIAQIREFVAKSSEFDNGYIFVGHSQGGIVSRAVIEEMDDHNVKRYISTAGLQNGQFIGPNKIEVSINDDAAFLAALVPKTMFDYSAYRPEDYYGKMQKEFVMYCVEHPEAQLTFAQFNVNRWPQFGSFSTINTFLPVYNNVNSCLPDDNQCILNQQRRKTNFLKLEDAHFFASPADDRIMPWQSSIFGRYSEVDTIEEIESKFMNLTVVDMKETMEYTADTFGLKTLNERGGLFFHEVPGVSHRCWRTDDGDCKWEPLYNDHLYAVLH